MRRARAALRWAGAAVTGGGVARRVALAGLVVVLLTAGAAGVWRAATASGPQTVQARTQQLASTLRCPTCQNLSVADSNAQIARGMREEIADQLAAGRTRQQVRAYFVDRYGEWILLSPQRDGIGWLAWLLPVAGLGVAAAGLGTVAARRRARDPGLEAAGSATLSAAAQQRVDEAAAAFAAGTLPAGDSAAGERLEAALVLLETVEGDPDATPAAQARARQRVLAALDDGAAAPAPATQPRGACEPEGVPDRAPAAATEFAGDVARAGAERGASPRSRATPDDAPAGGPWWRRRPVAWGALGVVFAVAVTVTLSASLSPRGAGELPTGSLPGQATGAQDSDAASRDAQAGAGGAAAGSSADTREALPGGAGTAGEGETIAALRQKLAANPDDTPSRLLLAARLLRNGQPRQAQSQAQRVLSAHPAHPDGLLLMGLAQASQRDPAATATLQRFLDRAPADHPGIEVARAVLQRRQAPGGGS